tara:strand:+ start:410 stop:820 length:411 start_codon:yes stop_codon:yes gene_type:complete
VIEHSLKGSHSLHLYSPIYGDWSFNGIEGIIYLEKLIPFLKWNKLKKIKINEIGWKGMHLSEEESINCPCCNGERYIKCDIDIPGIVALNTPNPYGKKYRMIDGKHRIRKRLNNGFTDGWFFVFTYKEIKKFYSQN